MSFHSLVRSMVMKKLFSQNDHLILYSMSDNDDMLETTDNKRYLIHYSSRVYDTEHVFLKERDIRRADKHNITHFLFVFPMGTDHLLFHYNFMFATIPIQTIKDMISESNKFIRYLKYVVNSGYIIHIDKLMAGCIML